MLVGTCSLGSLYTPLLIYRGLQLLHRRRGARSFEDSRSNEAMATVPRVSKIVASQKVG